MLRLSVSRKLCLIIASLLLSVSACSGKLLAQDSAVAASDLIAQRNVLVQAAKSETRDPATQQTIKARYARMEKILRETPAQARQFALDPATRAALVRQDPSNEALLEKDIRLTGELAAVVGDDFEHGTATTFYHLHTTVADIAISPAQSQPALRGLLHQSIAVTGISLPDVIAADSVEHASQEEEAALAAAIREVTSPNHLNAAVVRTAMTTAAATLPSVPAGAATSVCSPLGNQTIAVIILHYPTAAGNATYGAGQDSVTGWNNVFNGPTPSVADFINQSSFGQTSVSADVYGPITLPQSFDPGQTDAIAQAGFAAITGIVDFTRYNRYVFVFPAATASYGGLDSENCMTPTALVPHQYSVMWLPITPIVTLTPTPGLEFWTDVSHELGHGLGANHGDTLDFGTLTLGPIDYSATHPGRVNIGANVPAGPLPQVAVPAAGATNYGAIDTEYGDRYSMMGNSWTPASDYAPQEKIQWFGWIPQSGSADVTASGNFTLSPVESNTGLRALHVLRDAATNSWFWLEFHQPIGTYENVSLANLPTNNVTTGALVHYQDGTAEVRHSYIMNMAPVAAPNNFYLSNLTPGSSWSDPYSLVTLTAGAQGTTLPITVSYDTPCATVALDAQTLAVSGGTGTVTITAPATCSWQVSSNATWISFPGTTTGSGSAVLQYNYGANTSTAQRFSYITAQRQSLQVLQPSVGMTILGLNSHVVTVAPGAETALALNMIDLAGIADINIIQLTVQGGTTADCTITSYASGTQASRALGLLTGVNNLTTGTPGMQVGPSCTMDAGSSSWVTNGNNATLSVALSFPAGMTGIHGMSALVYTASGQATASIPLGYINIATAGPSATASPAAGVQGTTVPVTISGTNTAFTPLSTVSASAPGVTVTGVTYLSPNAITANVTIANNAVVGAFTLAVTSGTEVDLAPFTVNVPANVSISPSSGNIGSTVNYTLTGVNTNFTPNTAVTICGGTCGITATVNFGSATSLSGTLTIPQSTPTGMQTFTVTTGGQVLYATFAVGTAGVPSIIVTPATGAAGTTVPVTVTAVNMTIGTTSFYSSDLGGAWSFSNFAVLSPTTLTASIVISPTATVGPLGLRITTGNLTGGTTFTVTPAATPLLNVTPATGAAGSAPMPIMLTGSNTHLNVNSVLTSSDPNITVNNATTLNDTSMSATLTVGAAAHGSYTLTITTGSEVVHTTFAVNQLATPVAAIVPSSAATLPSQPVTLTASVAAPKGTSGTPTGQVAFFDTTIPFNQIGLGTFPLVNGSVSTVVSNPGLGTHTYSANYLGDSAFGPVAPATAASVVVAQATPAVTLAGVPTAVLYPQSATGLSFSVTVSNAAVSPTGSVTFTDGTSTLGLVPLVNGSATLSGVNLGIGSHSIVASYGGDRNFLATAGAAQQVSVQDFSIAAASNSLTLPSSGSASTTVTLAPVAGAFTQPIALNCSGAPANATCKVSLASVTPGSSATTATVTIQTGVSGQSILIIGAGSLLFLLTGLARRRLRRLRLASAPLLLLALALALGTLAGCGTSAPSTASGQYTLTLTGTAAGATSLSHATTVTLVVQ